MEIAEFGHFLDFSRHTSMADTILALKHHNVHIFSNTIPDVKFTNYSHHIIHLSVCTINKVDFAVSVQKWICISVQKTFQIDFTKNKTNVVPKFLSD